MVNGYVTLDLASKNIYKEALGAIKAQKPVMVVDAPDVYFADTIKTTTIDDDVVVQITKGGKTITINDVNAVSSEGDIQIKSHLWHYNICPDTTDYGFNITLPFDLGNDNVIINDNDSLNENKDFIQKLVDKTKIGSISYSCYSEDITKCCVFACIIKQTTSLSITFMLVNFSDGSDDELKFEIALTDGKVTSYTSGELQIYKNYQLI